MDKSTKVRAEVERLHNEYRNKKGALYFRKALRTVLFIIDSMQEEPISEDNTLRKASEEYLKVLSETPYNNTPITNAQTIVRELITFLDNPSKYNPNHIEEIVS